MTEHQLQKTLKKFQKIEPNKKWLERNRALLIANISEQQSQVEKQVVNESLHTFQKQHTVFSRISSFLSTLFIPTQRTFSFFKPAVSMIAITLVVLTSGIFTVSAAQESLPGDTLYGVKRATEKVQKALTTSEPEKAKLEIAFAGKRIKEFEALIQKEDSEEEKAEKVEEVLSDFNKNVTNAQVTLAALSDSEQHQDAADLAKDIDEKVSSYKDTLEKNVFEASKQVTDSAKKKAVEESVKKSVSVAEETSEASLSVIVEKHETGATNLTPEDVLRRIDLRLADVEHIFAIIDEQLTGALAASTTVSTTTTSTALFSDDVQLMSSTTLTTTTITTSTDVLSFLKETAAQARNLIEEARQLVEAASLSEAVSKITEGRKLIEGVQERLDELFSASEEDIASSEESEDASSNNTTSTPVTTGDGSEQGVGDELGDGSSQQGTTSSTERL